jgi:hypothetical protein
MSAPDLSGFPHPDGTGVAVSIRKGPDLDQWFGWLAAIQGAGWKLSKSTYEIVRLGWNFAQFWT